MARQFLYAAVMVMDKNKKKASCFSGQEPYSGNVLYKEDGRPGFPGDELYSRVKRYVLENKMTGPGESVIAGISGGADSLCLFMILLRMSSELGFYLHAVHVHHGLRESAEEDLKFVEELCRSCHVPCTCIRADTAARSRDWKTGVEEAGRRIRYEAFEQVRGSLEKDRGTPCRIAVAHHMEDQAETVLFHLCRGTDLRGAGGMLPVNGNLIRPLLMENRASIEAYLTGKGMSWRVDETNEDTTYTRNFLRREIIPRLSDGVNTAAVRHLARFADSCAGAERYLEKAAEKALHRCLVSYRLPDASGSSPDRGRGEKEKGEKIPASAGSGADSAGGMLALEIDALEEEDPYIRKRILHHALCSCAASGPGPGAVHVEAVVQLCRGKGSARLSMPGGITVVRENGRLLIAPDKVFRTVNETVPSFSRERESIHDPGKETKPATQKRALAETEKDGPHQKRRLPESGIYPVSPDAYSWRFLDFDGDLSSIPRNEYTKWFDYDKMAVFPVFRTRQAGDFMKLSTGAGRPELMTRKVARVMLDAGVPSRLRDRILFPCLGKEALWIPGLRMGDSCRITSGTTRILEITWTGAGLDPGLPG